MKKSSVTILLLGLILVLGVAITTSGALSQTQALVKINPPSQNVGVNQEVTVGVEVENVENLFCFDLSLDYNSSLLELDDTNSHQIGDFLGQNTLTAIATSSATPVPNIPEQKTFRLAVCKQGQMAGSSGLGTLFSLNFQALAEGTSPLTLSQVILLDSQGNGINTQIENAQVTISGPSSSPTPSPSPIPSPSPTPSPLPQAEFLLSPSSDVYFLGDSPEIEVYLDTWNNPVVGADLVLNFDPSVWEVSQILEGSIFPNYPGKVIDNTSGLIRVSGTVEPPDQYFSGRGVFARIIFETKTEGETTLGFEFTPNSPTTDCNIVAADGGELLTQAPLNGQYSLIFNPVLNFKYNLPHRLEEVGNQANVYISTDDQTFEATVDVDKSGIYEGLSLNKLILNQIYRFIIKIEGFLRKKADQEITLYGGSNPKEGYLDFGDLEAGDLNDDDIVNNLDLAELFAVYYESGAADFNGDGMVNVFDVWIMFTNFFKEAQVD